MLRTKKECQELDSNRPFIYKLDGQQIVFQKMSPDYIMKCPKCQIETRLIIGHVVKNPKCRNFFNVEKFKDQYKKYKELKTKEDNRKRKVASRAKMDNEKVQENNRKHKAASYAKLKTIDNKQVQDEDRKRKAANFES